MKKITPLKRCPTIVDIFQYLNRNRAYLLCIDDEQQNDGAKCMPKLIIPGDVVSGYTYGREHPIVLKKELEGVEPVFWVYYCSCNGDEIGRKYFGPEIKVKALYPRICKLYDEVVAKQRVVEALDKFLVLDPGKMSPIFAEALRRVYGVPVK